MKEEHSEIGRPPVTRIDGRRVRNDGSPHMRTNVAFVSLFCIAVGLFVLTSTLQPVELRNRLDFISQYTAGKIVYRGLASKLYDYQTQLSVQRQYGHDVPLLYIHPPFEALLFLPLAYLPYWTAFLVWGVINIAVLAAVLVLLGPWFTRLDTGSRLVLVGVLILPLTAVVGKGQDSALLVLAYVLAFRSMKKHRDFSAGCALGLGLFRFQAVIPLLVVFLVRRKWRVVLGALAVCAAFGLVSLWLVSWRGCLSYVDWLLSITGRANPNLAYIPQTDMPTLRGFVYLVLVRRLGTRSLSVLIGSGSIALLWWLQRQWSKFEDLGARSFDLLFSLSTVVAIMVAYHLLIHDQLLLVLPAAIVLDLSAREASRTGRDLWGLGKPRLVIPLVALFLAQITLVATDSGRFLGISFFFLLLFALGISGEIARDNQART
jgi:hypothetical protein